MYFYAKMLYAGCPGPSLAISVQFTLKMCRSRKSQKIHQTLLFWRSRLFKIIDVDINKKLVTIALCNRFHPIRANRGKI